MLPLRVANLLARQPHPAVVHASLEACHEDVALMDCDAVALWCERRAKGSACEPEAIRRDHAFVDHDARDRLGHGARLEHVQVLYNFGEFAVVIPWLGARSMGKENSIFPSKPQV